MDSFIKKIFERNPTIHVESSDFLIQNNFPFFKVSLVKKNRLVRRNIFKNYLGNHVVLGFIDGHLKRIAGNRFFGIKLPNKFSKNFQ